MKNTGIFYGSTTGNTEMVAQKIADKLSAKTYDVSNSSASVFAQCDNIILGSSTLGYGDLQDDWDDFIEELKKADLSGKTVALFGLGDADSYPDTFADAVGIIYQTIKDKNCIIVGQTSLDGYNFDESKANVDGKFIGLIIDEDNQSKETDMRIDAWVKQIEVDFN